MRHLDKAILRYPNLWRGCVGAWAPLLGISGRILRDNSGFGHHATLVNFGTLLDNDCEIKKGIIGVKCDQQPIAGRIETSYDYGFLTASTFSVFVRVHMPATILTFGQIIGQRQDASTYEWSLRAAASNVFNVLFTGGSVSGATTLVANAEYTLAFTFNRGAVSLYVNGVLDGIGTQTITSQTGDLVIGDYNNGAGGSEVLFHEGAIYNRILTQSEIRLLASKPGIAYETNQRRSYKSAAFAPSFRPAWASQRTQIIGGGSR